MTRNGSHQPGQQPGQPPFSRRTRRRLGVPSAAKLKERNEKRAHHDARRILDLSARGLSPEAIAAEMEPLGYPPGVVADAVRKIRSTNREEAHDDARP